jgi:chromosome partitioning protein
MIYETSEGVDVIPSDPGLEGSDNNLANVPIEERYTKLEAFISADLSHYDLVILDLPGKSDNIAINGLVAAGDVIAPVKPGKFEQNQLGQIEADLRVIREEDLEDVSLPRPLALRQVIVTMYQQNRRLQEAFVEHVETEYPDLVAPAVVNHTEDILHVQADGHTLFGVSDEALYDTGKRARAAYYENTADLLDRLRHE